MIKCSFISRDKAKNKSYFVVLCIWALLERLVLGVNLNPFAFIQSFKDDSQSIIITAMNISFFIPIGFYLETKALFLY